MISANNLGEIGVVLFSSWTSKCWYCWPTPWFQFLWGLEKRTQLKYATLLADRNCGIKWVLFQAAKRKVICYTAIETNTDIDQFIYRVSLNLDLSDIASRLEWGYMCLARMPQKWYCVPSIKGLMMSISFSLFFWLCWVIVAAHRLSLVVRGSYSLVVE